MATLTGKTSLDTLFTHMNGSEPVPKAQDKAVPSLVRTIHQKVTGDQDSWKTDTTPFSFSALPLSARFQLYNDTKSASPSLSSTRTGAVSVAPVERKVLPSSSSSLDDIPDAAPAPVPIQQHSSVRASSASSPKRSTLVAERLSASEEKRNGQLPGSLFRESLGSLLSSRLADQGDTGKRSEVDIVKLAARVQSTLAQTSAPPSPNGEVKRSPASDGKSLTTTSTSEKKRETDHDPSSSGKSHGRETIYHGPLSHSSDRHETKRTLSPLYSLGKSTRRDSRSPDRERQRDHRSRKSDPETSSSDRSRDRSRDRRSPRERSRTRDDSPRSTSKRDEKEGESSFRTWRNHKPKFADEDWTCTMCGLKNFARRIRCYTRNCKGCRPLRISSPPATDDEFQRESGIKMARLHPDAGPVEGPTRGLLVSFYFFPLYIYTHDLGVFQLRGRPEAIEKAKALLLRILKEIKETAPEDRRGHWSGEIDDAYRIAKEVDMKGVVTDLPHGLLTLSALTDGSLRYVGAKRVPERIQYEVESKCRVEWPEMAVYHKPAQKGWNYILFLGFHFQVMAAAKIADQLYG